MRRKRGGNNVLFYSIILISSYFIVSKFRGLITILVLLLSIVVSYLPISNYEVWSNMICRIYLCPFVVFMTIFDFITLIYLALYNDKDFLIRLWNGD